MSEYPAALYARMQKLVEDSQPLTGDVRAWLLAGLYRWERGMPLDRALGLNGESGKAWGHPVRQQRRGRLEGLIIYAADLAGGRTSWIAGEIARELSDDPDRPAKLPGISKDFLSRLRRLYPGEYPRSRTRIIDILKGETQAHKDGAVRSRRAIESIGASGHDANYGNTASNLALRRHR